MGNITKEHRLEILVSKVTTGRLNIDSAINRAIQHDVLYHFLSLINVKRWIEDYVDKDTKQIVSIARYDCRRKK